MQLTISSDDPRDHVLETVGALLGVRLRVVEEPAPEAGLDDDERVTKTRH